MTAGSNDLKITWEWEPASSVKAAEHRATWARIEIRIGSECLTLVEDRESSSSRRSIYCPLYPMAEWIAYNWWLLQADARPASRLGLAWMQSAAERTGASRGVQRHCLRSAGDGFLWPDLLIIPEGGQTRLIWRRDRELSPERPTKFLTYGDRLIDSATVTHALSYVVESVLARLEDQGLPDTTLAQEWTTIQNASDEEAEFCLAAARLGLDPYSETDEVEDLLQQAAKELDGKLLDDFLDAVDPALIVGGLNWVSKARRQIERTRPEASAIVANLLKSIDLKGLPIGSRPWMTGWEHARHIREAIGTGPASRFEPRQYLRITTRATDDPGLQAVGGIHPQTMPMVVVGRPLPQRARRFTLSRAFWHVVSQEEPLFLVSSAYTDRQKVERAFAAEILAPAEGIRQQLGSDISKTTPEDLERIADHFDVSTMVIQHQLENQILA